MSNSSRTDPSSVIEELPSTHVGPVVREPIAGVAFWSAIALPFLYIPLLARGLDTHRLRVAFVVLLVLNVLTLLLGHSYRGD